MGLTLVAKKVKEIEKLMQSTVETVQEKLNIASQESDDESEDSGVELSDQSEDDRPETEEEIAERMKGRTVLKAKRRFPQTQPTVDAAPASKRAKKEPAVATAPKRSTRASKVNKTADEEMKEEVQIDTKSKKALKVAIDLSQITA